MDHGWANKYFWFTIINKYPPGQGDFENRIKKGELIFTKQSGTTPADIHGSAIALNLYSERLMKLLKNYGVKFLIYKIKFVREPSKIGNYYYLELKDELPIKRINGKAYFLLKDWEGQDMFTIKDTTYAIITEKLKNILEKERLANVKFGEFTQIK